MLYDCGQADLMLTASLQFNNHSMGSKVRSVDWSLNSKLYVFRSKLISIDLVIATGGDDGSLNLSNSSSGQKL